MIKKVFIWIALLITAAIAVVFVYRHTIIQYSAEQIIRRSLPPYVKLEKIRLDFSANRIILQNLKILNPVGFSYPYLIEIGNISCRYRIKGIGIPEGLEISDISVKRFNMTVERLDDSRINLIEEKDLVSNPRPLVAGPEPPAPEKENKPGGNKKLSDIIKLPPSLAIKDARIEFLDRVAFYDKPHLITIDNVEGDISIKFNDYYTQILSVAFTLEGNLNGASNETIKWIGSLNPATPKLTMSNRFEVENLDIIAFEPYYDRFSPFIFKRGKFSGALVFDFNNGDIGSTNEIRLSDILFWVKPGYENSQMWETNVQNLMYYFTTASGDVVFDFKIKGDITKPDFYLGPISKRAMTSMAIGKISSYAVEQVTNPAGGAAKQIDKAKEYIDLFKGFINRK